MEEIKIYAFNSQLKVLQKETIKAPLDGFLVLELNGKFIPVDLNNGLDRLEDIFKYSLRTDPEKEEWKDVIGYEGYYMISSWGRIKSIFRKEKFLKPRKDKGSLTVSLSKNCNPVNCRVHRLIADAFIPNPLNKPQVGHKNGIQTDNRLENLEWRTKADSLKHSYKLGTRFITKGINNALSKLDNNQAEEIVKLANSGKELKEIAKSFSLSLTHVKEIASGRFWQSSKQEEEYVKHLIERAQKSHGNKYGYSKVDKKVNSLTKVTIICPEHGEFKQSLLGHASGNGCLKCVGTIKATEEETRLKLLEIAQEYPGVNGKELKKIWQSLWREKKISRFYPIDPDKKFSKEVN